jgi:hypothetical protein
LVQIGIIPKAFSSLLKSGHSYLDGKLTKDTENLLLSYRNVQKLCVKTLTLTFAFAVEAENSRSFIDKSNLFKKVIQFVQ